MILYKIRLRVVICLVRIKVQLKFAKAFKINRVKALIQLFANPNFYCVSKEDLSNAASLLYWKEVRRRMSHD